MQQWSEFQNITNM